MREGKRSPLIDRSSHARALAGSRAPRSTGVRTRRSAMLAAMIQSATRGNASWPAVLSGTAAEAMPAKPMATPARPSQVGPLKLALRPTIPA